MLGIVWGELFHQDFNRLLRGIGLVTGATAEFDYLRSQGLLSDPFVLFSAESFRFCLLSLAKGWIKQTAQGKALTTSEALQLSKLLVRFD